ncbi:enoyl-CoA hydratase-related protein [Paraburkholderia silviterrae]|uniref:Enoyl-CoA hydratase/isomerase-like protein n=1 Tax=Paraburkholderia silviterrae TaxID=2528715 RepID=A0A4R5M138_9BURK|nr:enoyl-CoA hydratase-related protein [Paraburkholderia silviterrae]TDG18979.1 hypothetical protein EYW47_32150 [Paraburkholderia silviterrae]
MEGQPVLTGVEGRVGTIALNRPKQPNALDDALMDALGEALLRFDADESIGAIVIGGSEKAFAAGAVCERGCEGRHGGLPREARPGVHASLIHAPRVAGNSLRKTDETPRIEERQARSRRAA